MGMNDLAYLGIAELRASIASGELSPVDLCEVLLARHERLGPRLNAFITLSADRILSQARAAERELMEGRNRGSLHGIPIAVKDVCCTKGERSTAGSKVLGDFVPDEDATVVARLRSAGAIIFGKTNMPEFAYGPVDQYHYGPSRNPWDLERFPGGSSMGSAVALAGGLVPGAIGSDTAGSIRLPAHWSGVTGLKPTYGLVPLRGVIPLAPSLDHIGPMSRSAYDCALLLGAMAGYDSADATSVRVPVSDYTAELSVKARGLRIGVPRSYFWESLSSGVSRALEAALAELGRLGVVLQDVHIPDWEAAAEATDELIRCEAASEYRVVLKERPGALISQIRQRLETGTATPATAYVDALRTARRLRVTLRRLYEQVDLLALPGQERTALRMDASGTLLEPFPTRDYTGPLNLVGLPAIAMPCGFDHEELPVGLQLAGRAWEEDVLLRVAHAYQQATDWHRRRPELPP